MSEVFPFAAGLVLGGLLGLLRPRIRLAVGAVCAVVLGVLATVLSGEFRTTWGYLLIDIPLVAGAAFLGLVLTSRVLHPALRRR